MASTGLLTGINPYKQQRSVIDISSKPLNLAVQLEQKEQAKRDALDKYFMDYEKSINPAGLRKQEADVFMEKLAQNKAFYLKNRDAILNPSKYGYDAQSQYMANFKDMTNLINQSKKAAAEDKALNTILNQARVSGKRVSDNVFDMLERSRKPIGFGYEPPDASLLEIYKPHNEKQFTTNVWGGIKLPTKEEYEKGAKGTVVKKTYELLNDDIIKNAALGAVNEYRNNRGTREYFDELFQDKGYTAQINTEFKKRFNKDISSGSDLAIGYALTQKPGGLMKTEAPEYSWIDKFNMTQAAINARANQGQDVDAVEQYLSDAKAGKTFAGAEGENIEMVNFPETILKDLGRNKKPAVVGRGIGDGEFYNIVYQKDAKGNVTDLIDWGQTQKIPQSQIRAAVVKHALPSGAKVKLIRGDNKGTPNFVNARKFN